MKNLYVLASEQDQHYREIGEKYIPYDLSALIQLFDRFEAMCQEVFEFSLAVKTESGFYISLGRHERDNDEIESYFNWLRNSEKMAEILKANGVKFSVGYGTWVNVGNTRYQVIKDENCVTCNVYGIREATKIEFSYFSTYLQNVQKKLG